MTPEEETIRRALNMGAGLGVRVQEQYMTPAHLALDALVAEAERDIASLRLELDGLEFVRVKDNGYLIERAEAAEARVAALTEAITTAMRALDRAGRAYAILGAALAAADRPEGTTPDGFAGLPTEQQGFAGLPESDQPKGTTP